MNLRPYTPADNDAILALFRDTVHTIAAKDYTAPQLEAWAPDLLNAEAWCCPLAASYTLAAEREGELVGFANLDDSGQLDRLYVHKDYQRQGIARALCQAIEAQALLRGFQRVYTYASITAKPFFLAQGYTLEQENIVCRAGQTLRNFQMSKGLTST